MKTLLIGNFGDQNLGDELILDAALDTYGADNVVVMTADSDFSQKFTGKNFETMPPFPTGIRSFFRLIFSSEYRSQLLKNRENIERVVFVGGGLFAIKFKAYFIWWITSFWIKKVFNRVPIVWEYQGIDNPKNVLEQWLLKKALMGTKVLSVRDEVSLGVLESIGIESELKDDRVFEGLNKKAEIKKNKKNILLLNAIKPMSTKAWVKVQDLAYNQNLEIIFVAFTPKDKKNIPINFRGKVKFLPTKKQLFRLFSLAKIVVGERFHGLVMGQHFCPKTTFVLRDPYSQKVKNFCEKYGIRQL